MQTRRLPREAGPGLGAAVAVLLVVVGDGTAVHADDKSLLDVANAKFSSSTEVDNPYMPLRPGHQYVYEGFTVEDGEEIEHRVVFTVTDLKKEINGIEALVIYDRDFTEGRLLEAELTFFAQDDDGNVWHLGQHREIYDEVELVGGRMWVVGHLEGARAGIMMTAEPVVSEVSYSQGFAPAPFNWTDRARVVEVGATTTVAAGSYTDVLVTEEFSDEEPGAFQLKYYAPDVGNVRVGWRGDDPNQEELELVEIIELDDEALAEMRAEALMLEQRAYVYGTTRPAERLAR